MRNYETLLSGYFTRDGGIVNCLVLYGNANECGYMIQGETAREWSACYFVGFMHKIVTDISTNRGVITYCDPNAYEFISANCPNDYFTVDMLAMMKRALPIKKHPWARY